jgi:voltage-gated potassium channel
LGYIAIDNFSLSDAIYQTGITFTTVGFGEIAPISNAGRLFTILLIILGFAVFSYAVGLIVEVINNGRLIKLIKENGMLYRIARLKKHIVIFYHNEFTIALSKELRKAHIPFVVVDENLTEEEAQKWKYPYFIRDNPNKEIVLKKSHLSSAKGVVTLSPNIAENIAIITSARLYERELARKPYYILSISHNREEYNKLKKLGADEVITPTQLTAQRFTALIVDPEVNNILEKFVYSINTPLDLEELKLPPTSWIIGRPLKEAQLRKRYKVTVIGIQRRYRFIPTPDGEEKIEEGDILLLIGSSRGMAQARKILTSPIPPTALSLQPAE